VRIREAFTTRAFNDSCGGTYLHGCDRSSTPPSVALIVTYDYHPLATTLFDTFLIPKAAPSYQGQGMILEPVEPIPEATIWSFVIQISNAMKAVHDRGLAFRVIDATKILLTGASRSERR
jgi:PAB-dependent poly(A)-specific ribonuclease subunit 3